MAQRDPFQKSFSTVEEMLSNPRKSVRENPSKAYERLVAAVKADPGGWIRKLGDFHYYGVLKGPLTGTYVLGSRSNRYMPRFQFGLPYLNVITMPLFRHSLGAVLDKIHPILEAVLEIRPWDTKNFDPKVEAPMGPEEYDEFSRWALTDEQGSSAQLARYDKDPEKYRAGEAEHKALRGLTYSRQYRDAEKLYILSQAGGVPVEEVAAALRQKPKRLLGLATFDIPTRGTDRTRFAAEFLRTWSYSAALKRILPNVEGDISQYVSISSTQTPQVYRDLLSGVASWKQLAERDTMAWQDSESLGSIRAAYERGDFPALRTAKEQKDINNKNWIERMLLLQRSANKAGIKAAEFRALMRKHDNAQLTLLVDAMVAIDRGVVVLAETPEGRLLIRAREERDWPRILRGHDLATAAAGEASRRDLSSDPAEQLADAEKFKRGAEQFNFPPGVKPLVTEPEYAREGSEMTHCVRSMSYHLSRAGYEFAFEAPDGTRATLELAKEGVVRQFFGPSDSPPSVATKRLLNEFLKLNAANIAQMRAKRFPVYGKDSKARPEREAYRNGLTSLFR